MNRNDRTLARRLPAEGAEPVPGRPVEPQPDAALAPPAAPGGEITISQRVEISPVQPERAASAEPAVPRAQRQARHTLVLIGELDRGSTHTLEAEIERLCDAGIAAITLDLTKLSAIDSAGVAVIAFRSSWCRRRGHELVLIPGPRSVQRAFELAGVARALTFMDEDPAM